MTSEISITCDTLFSFLGLLCRLNTRFLSEDCQADLSILSTMSVPEMRYHSPEPDSVDQVIDFYRLQSSVCSCRGPGAAPTWNRGIGAFICVERNLSVVRSETIHDADNAPAEGGVSMHILNDSGASYTAEMTVQQWVALPDHPRQRDTVRQARKGHWDLARVARGAALESLRWVDAAELHGQLYKVDGHTRGLLWSKGKLPNPGTVFVKVYRCHSREELNELYGTFDTQSAAETMFDQVTGAYREQGLTLSSKRLRSGTIVDALSIATRGVARRDADEFDIYDAVRTFAPELQRLDAVNPRPETFHTGVVSAALLSIALDPSTLEFFRLLSHGEGSKREGLPDPIEGTLCTIGKIKKRGSSWVKSRQEQLCAITLGAVAVWKKGETAPGFWSGKYEPAELPQVVLRVRELKSSARASD